MRIYLCSRNVFAFGSRLLNQFLRILITHHPTDCFLAESSYKDYHFTGEDVSGLDLKRLKCDAKTCPVFDFNSMLVTLGAIEYALAA